MKQRSGKKRGHSSRKRDHGRSTLSVLWLLPFCGGNKRKGAVRVTISALLIVLLIYFFLSASERYVGHGWGRNRHHDRAPHYKAVDIESLPPSLRKAKVTGVNVLHPMNDNMAFQRGSFGVDPLQSGVSVEERYRDLALGYLAPFRNGIQRNDYMKVIDRSTYRVTPPGANRGLQSVLFQVKGRRLYMSDPHGVARNGKHFYLSRVYEVMWLLGKLAREGRLPTTEFVLSIHDCVQTVRHENRYRTAKYLESSPSFTLIACNFSDNIPLPVWEGAAQRGGHLREWDKQMEDYGQDDIAWKDKVSKAVFRGGNRQSMYFRRQEDANNHCHDVGRSKLLHVAQRSPQLFNVSLSGGCGAERYTLERLSPREHHQFKYVVYMEGNCMWADRLKTLVFGPSAIVKQETACGQFFEPLLKRFVHYLPTEYFLGDVEEVVQWARRNENEVRSIVDKANEFACKFLTLSAIESYVETVVTEYTKLLVNQTVELEKDAVDVTNND